MKIIHYCLGIPPLATGGLTIYANSLAKIQAKNNEVIIIYPGYKKNKIHLKFIKKENNIKIYRLDGALPVSLTYGVKNPLDFIKNKDLKEIENEFNKLSHFDIIHLHTIQGIYPEILKYFKEKNIKIIFTTHDFYPFSLTTKLYEDNELNIKNNIIQSLKAPNTNALYLNRRPFINKLKKIKFIKKIFNKKIKENNEIKYDLEYEKDYINKSNKLYDYYKDMFKYIDLVHANSKISMDIYSKIHNNIKVLPISHDKINKHDIKKTEDKILRIGFFGEQIKEKGFDLLLNKLDLIYEKNNNFILNTYGHSNLYERPYLKYNGSYKLDDLEEIYKNLDVVIFPTINLESFGFIVLEALSYNTPVIVSKNVGAKDLCNPKYIINNDEDFDMILNKIIKNKSVLSTYFDYELNIINFIEHNEEIIDKIYK